jgi:hypothetical protein
MKKFLFIYNASEQDDSGNMDDWTNWFKSLGDHLIDIGNPIQGGTLVKGNSVTELSSFTDFVGGYSLVSAADLAEAVNLAKTSPNQAGIRVFEALSM